MTSSVYAVFVVFLLVQSEASSYPTTGVQQFTVAEQQPAGAVIGRVVGLRPPLRAYFRAGSDAERDLAVSEEDGYITARSVIDREALDPAGSAQYRFVVASGVDDAAVTVTVFVADVNDHAPTFPDDLVELTVSEASPLDSRLSLLPAVDRDIGTNSVQVGYPPAVTTLHRMSGLAATGCSLRTSENYLFVLFICPRVKTNKKFSVNFGVE